MECYTYRLAERSPSAKVSRVLFIPAAHKMSPSFTFFPYSITGFRGVLIDVEKALIDSPNCLAKDKLPRATQQSSATIYTVKGELGVASFQLNYF